MFQSIPQMLFHTISKYPDKDVFRFKRDGEIKSITYTELKNTINKLVHGMLAHGIKQGDRIAILSNNRPEWPITDFATFIIHGIVVPIYQTLPPLQIKYILNDAKVRAIFVEDDEQYAKVKEIASDVPSLEYIFSFDELSSADDQIATYDSLLRDGADGDPGKIEELIDTIDPMETCSLVYTSGTTGNPKGVMLHQKGFVIDIIHSEAILNLLPEDIFMSFLPLSHLYERLAGHWCPIYRGATIHYAQSINTVINDIAETKPTVMVSVPRLYEKIASAVFEQVENGSPIKRKIFNWSLKTGLTYHKQRISGKASRWLEKKYNFADKVAFTKIKQKLGGSFRYPIAGGAPLSVETLKFFEAIGLRIIEGYGMTETHLIITLTPFGKTKYGSCGKPLDCLQLKVAEDGEVLVKGDTLMKGYYNRPELTHEVIDEEGWLHTGDIGYLDDENFLFLTDRKKNIIVTSGGKNVASAPIENRLKQSKYIDDVCLIGNNRKFISALIIPSMENLKKWAGSHGINTDDNAALIKNPGVVSLIQQEIENLQTDFARFEKVKKFALLAEPLSIEKGELTPSLKIKKNVIEEKFKDVIEQLYRED
ncbi:long-chain fatty acid--CoA ligase [candidate division KSB1 bacterium]|nr:long-chain fatty acid--CoA ligase [candidate division KSB1 bacterium]